MKTYLGLLLLTGIQAGAMAGECTATTAGLERAYLLPTRLEMHPPRRMLAWAGETSLPAAGHARQDYFPNPGEGADLRDPYAGWLHTGGHADITAMPPSERLLDRLISPRELRRQHTRSSRQAGMRSLLFGLLAMGLGARR